MRVDLGEPVYASKEKPKDGKKIVYPIHEDSLLASTDITQDSLMAAIDPRYLPTDYSEDEAITFEQEIFVHAGDIPDRLVTVNNGRGGTMDLEYKLSSTYTDGNENANANLPMNMWTVERITVSDSVSNTENSRVYHYSDGKYQTDVADEREFVGFGKVKKTYENGRKEVSLYHQDPVMKGRVYHADMKAGNGKILQQTKNKYTVEEDGVRSFAKLDETATRTFFGGETKSTAEAYTYDPDTGNVVSQKHFGEVNVTYAPLDTSKFFGYQDIADDAITTNYTYAEHSEGKIVSAPSQIETFDVDNNLLSRNQFRYDNLAAGNIDDGNLTHSDVWFDDENRFITSEFVYNEFGKPIEKRDPLGNATFLEYENLNLYTDTIRNERGHEVQFVYDTYIGKPTQVTDANGFVAQVEYDGFGRVLESSVQASENSVEQVVLAEFSYHTSSLPHSVRALSRAENHADEFLESRTYFDGLQRTVQSRAESIVEGEEAVVVTENAYNDNGQLSYSSLAFADEGLSFTNVNTNRPGTEFTYDVLNRVIETTTPVGTIATEYVGWQTETVNANSQRSVAEADAFGKILRVSQFIDGRELTTEYVYSPTGNLMHIIDAEGNKREFVYDSLNRRVSASQWYRAEGSPIDVWTYQFNDLGLITSKTDPRGITLNYTYDDLNRLITETASNGDHTVRYTYDTAENGIGKVDAITGNQYEIAHEYDHLGRVVEKTETIQGDTFVTENSFDNAGLLEEIVYPNGDIVTYTYNSANQLTDVAYQEFEGNTRPIVEDITYSELGQIVSMVQTDGSTITNEYDVNQMYRLVEKATTVNGELAQSFGYTYDNVGNITSIADAMNNETTQYTYDDLNRLVQSDVVATDLEPYTRTYHYDDIGNIVYKSDVGNYEYNEANPQQLSEVSGEQNISYTYDAAGNILSKNGQTFTWDAGGRISSVSGDANGTFVYDPTGKRVVKTLNGNTKKYVGEIFENVGDENTMYVFAGNQRVATIMETPEEVIVEPEPVESARGAALVADTSNTILVASGDEPEIIRGEDVALSSKGATVISSNYRGYDIISGENQFSYGRTTIDYLSQEGINSYTLMYARQYTQRQDNKFLIDLGAEYDLNEIALYIHSSYAATYRIEVSTDNENFETVAETTDLAIGHRVHEFDTRSVRYIKIRGLKNRFNAPYGNMHFLVREVEARVNTVVEPEPEIIPEPEEAPEPEVDSTDLENRDVYYHHPDHLGSTSLTTDVDGNVVEDVRYFPYGGERARSGLHESSFTFTDQESDDEIALMYYDARYYDPVVGRFMSNDPLQEEVDRMVKLGELNGYRYTLNNPVVYTDPTGEAVFVIMPDPNEISVIELAPEVPLTKTESQLLIFVGSLATGANIKMLADEAIGFVTQLVNSVDEIAEPETDPTNTSGNSNFVTGESNNNADAVYTDKSHKHTEPRHHDNDLNRYNNRSKFSEGEGGQAFTDEVINKSDGYHTNSNNGFHEYEADLGRTVGQDGETWGSVTVNPETNTVKTQYPLKK